MTADLLHDPRVDTEFVHDDGHIRRAISWSASLQCWAWRCWDLETGALLGSGTAKGFVHAEDAAVRCAP